MASSATAEDVSVPTDPFLGAESFTQDLCAELRLQTISFQNEKGIHLYGRYWKPAGPPKALVCIVHGFGEYLLPYHQVGLKLAGEGCLAFGHDHMGHGRSSGERATQPHIENFVTDVLGHVKIMKSYYPNIPIFIVGHSMGGMITLLSVAEEPQMFSGMILIGPFISMNWTIILPIQKLLAITLSRIAPNLEVGKININDVTADPQMREWILKDPLWWTRGIKAQMAAAFMHGINKVDSILGAVNIPMLIIHGEKDMLCNPEGSKRLFATTLVADKELKDVHETKGGFGKSRIVFSRFGGDIIATPLQYSKNLGISYCFRFNPRVLVYGLNQPGPNLKIYPGAKHHLYMEPKEIREMAVKDTVEWIVKRIRT